MSSWLLGRLAGHVHDYSIPGDDIPVFAQDAPTQSSRTFLRIFFLRWIPMRKATIIKTIIIVVSGFSWLHVIHKYYSAGRPSLESSSTTHAPQIYEDDTHHIFRSSKPSLTSRNPLNIRAYDSMSDGCVEQWVVYHTWGPACIDSDLSDGLKVDGVWAWVNGSDPLQIISRQRYRPTGNMQMDANHRYTEHNELLFSMRSALASLGPDVMQKLHIIASAYHHSNESDPAMVGQVPAWLDKEEALRGDGLIALHHDSNYFKLVGGPQISFSLLEIQKWKDAVIPSFNSLAVESQIHNIHNTVSDQVVYFNDDFFTLRKLAVSDYTTPLYGPVIKTFTRITSRYTPAEHTIYRIINPAGEEPGIKRAAWVLGKRFSMRSYYYITHHPRTLSLPLLLEAAQTFPEAFSNTPLSRFRAQSDVPMSIQAVFLSSWYIVERHREALLWTWAVARWGGTDEVITPMLKDLMWIELADRQSPSKSYLNVRVPVRAPIENVGVFKKTNVDLPTSTEYSFSSKDGYALSYVDAMWFWDRPRHGYPDLTQGLHQIRYNSTILGNGIRLSKDPGFVPAKACMIFRATCFGSAWANETASDFFKRIAFELPKCGDCIVTALIGASGQSGIDKFLPHHNIGANPGIHSEAPTRPPHLPLTSDWTTTDFSLSNIEPEGPIKHGTALRNWCIRLIQRYSYVLGSVGSDLYKVERASNLESKLDEIVRKVQEDTRTASDDSVESLDGLRDRWSNEMGEGKGPLAFLCLNDDVKETGELRNRVDELLNRFFRGMWTGKMSFERSN